MKNINQFITNHTQCLGSWASVVTIISLPLIFLSLILVGLQLSDILTKPNVNLEFVHPTSIAYKVNNSSSVIAEGVLVSFGIFDIDTEPPSILPIPGTPLDYVNPKSEKGPFKFLGQYGTKGHRYFGILYVGCKGCDSLNTYWIYAQHGSPNESFYVKRNNKDTYEVNPSRIKNDKSYLEQLVPTARRKYIKR